MTRTNTPVLLALAILAIAAASIAAALVFEALGYQPCDLCLKERIPYYAAMPVAGLAVLFAARRQKSFMRPAFAVLALIFTASAAFGVYHAGIEWGFWPGPQECSGVLERARSAEDFLAQLQSAKVVRCDAAAIRIFGLSLAGWNAVISAGLAAIALAGTTRTK
ncbi:MAG: disulfide bond formation protein B [Beijerinckiaceae bacterium]|nr:disulfide bond formation protein B [Beijerinckiaceae bacterium]